MKKIYILAFIMMIFTGCRSGANNEPDETNGNNQAAYEARNEIVGTILDFFPFEENTMYRFTSETLVGNQDIFTTHISGNRKQQRITTHNIEMTAVLEHADGYLRQVFTFPNHYIYEDITDITSNINIVILSEPLMLGHSWEAGDLDGVSTITSVDTIVQTPMGEIEAIQVTTEFRNGDLERVYFGRGLGIVKTDYTTTTQDVTINVTNALSEVVRGEGFEVEKLFFHPDDMVLNVEAEQRTVIIETNQDFVQLFEDALRQAPSGRENGVIGEDVQINSIELDRAISLVTVDFSSNFIDNLGGSGHEDLILQSLANTFGRFYSVGNFRITLDGQNYESGHFYMEENDFITVY